MANVVSPIIKKNPLGDELKNVYQFFSKKPFNKCFFITLKDNQQRPAWKKMDKVRKWISKFSSHYIIVRSPKEGVHFHALVFADRNRITFFKGIHIKIDPIAKPDNNKIIDFEQFKRSEPHPCFPYNKETICKCGAVYYKYHGYDPHGFDPELCAHDGYLYHVKYKAGVQIMEVNSELRQKFGGFKMSLCAREKGRIAARRYKTMRALKASGNFGRVLNYLIQNFNENPIPDLFKDIYISTNIR